MLLFRILFFCVLSIATGFVAVVPAVVPPLHFTAFGLSHRSSTVRDLLAVDEGNSGALIGDDVDDIGGADAAPVSDESLLEALRLRQDELKQGIGRRYRVRTTRGFLNVHSTYKDGPFALDNVVRQLQEGEIVTSVGPKVENWVEHDQGGWSIAEFEGFTWLVPLEE